MQPDTYTWFCKRASIVLVLIVMISGCASGLSKDECNVADWRAIGYEDGVKGWSEARISQHRKACAKHGVALQLNAYRTGWEQGINRYCRPGNGYHLGRTGKQYSGVCPSNLEADFIQAYGHGKELYRLKANVAKIKRSLNHNHARLSDIEVEMRDTGIELVTEGVTTEYRVVLLDELRKLEQERQATKARIPELEYDLEMEQEHLATISAEHKY